MKKIKIVSLIFIVEMLFFTNVSHAETVKEYVIEKGQSIFFSRDDLKNNSLKSEDDKIVTVSNGIVTAREVGETFCTSVDLADKKIYKIKVVPSVGLKYLTSEPNNPKKGDILNLYAITDGSVQNVIFKIETNKGSFKVNATEKIPDKNNVIYKGYFNADYSGEIKITVQILKENQWCEVSNKDLTLNIDNCKSRTGMWFPSDKCISYIKSKEGFKSKISVDSIASSLYDIGYGNLIFPEKPFYDDITSFEATAILTEKLNNGNYNKLLNNFLKINSINVTQNQFDALLSFTYNIGPAWLRESDLRKIILDIKGQGAIKVAYVNSDTGLNLRMQPNIKGKIIRALRQREKVIVLNSDNDSWYQVRTSDNKIGFCAKEYLTLTYDTIKDLESINKKEFSDEFLLYHRAAGRCIKGLLNRRIEELQIFFYNDYNLDGYKNKYNFETPNCH